VARQPEGVVRSPRDTVDEAQALLDAGRPFHAHEVFEDAWKSGPPDERGLWRGLAQLAVGLTHAARGNVTGGARLLRRGAGALEEWAADGGRVRPYGLELAELADWARELAGEVERAGVAVDARARAPRLGAGDRR
jgi:predicted metal-dependent hydrolase